MAIYNAQLIWRRQPTEIFTDRRYSRAHLWRFDGGLEVPASASPHIVPPPYSAAENLDPEEAFVAALASCHMLFFLSLAAERQLCVESYEDNAFGVLAADAEGKMAMTQVSLRPKVTFATSTAVEAAIIADLHHEAHARCFIANSVKSEIKIIPQG